MEKIEIEIKVMIIISSFILCHSELNEMARRLLLIAIEQTWIMCDEMMQI